MKDILPLLPLLLICPLGMVIMMLSMWASERGARRREASGDAGRPPRYGADHSADLTTTEEHRELGAEIGAGLQELDDRIAVLEAGMPEEHAKTA